MFPRKTLKLSLKVMIERTALLQTAPDSQSDSETTSEGDTPTVTEAAVSYRVEPPMALRLGLAVPHRRLLEALQNGWLPPPSEAGGHVLGNGFLVREPGDLGKNSILLRLYFDVSKLPQLSPCVYSDGTWSSSAMAETGTKQQMHFWPGALPTSAITSLSVSTGEERNRLVGIASHLSNVTLPVDVQVEMEDDVMQDPPPNPPLQLTPTVHQSLIKVPEDLDAIQGAMTMAVWAVPRIDPWLDVLVASLSSDRERLVKSAERVAAPWWRDPPWTHVQWLRRPEGETTPEQVRNNQDTLWRAAIEVLGDKAKGANMDPMILVERIADLARDANPDGATGISNWMYETHRILRAETTVRPDQWQDFPIGLTIQLVLARPEPARFRTWPRDLPDLQPRVWWSAAVLCGWSHGYKRLDTIFRGKTSLQEVLSAHALRTSTPDLRKLSWPSADGEPHWCRKGDGFNLLWGNKEISHISGSARSRWYAADFSDERIRQAAFRVLNDMNWPCGHYRVRRLSDSRIVVEGSFDMVVGKRATEIRGEMDIRLPSNAEIEDVLDVDSFREHLVNEIGRLPDPPSPNNPEPFVRSTKESPVKENLVPGLKYTPGFLSEDEENEIIEKIDKVPENWSTELKRRVQHFGWRYNYKAGQVDRSMRIGPLPDWADKLAKRLVDRDLVPVKPDQLIVNEYRGDQGISKHVDSKASFDDHIATISLLESWEMVFRKGNETHRLLLEKGSVAVLSGPSRSEWTHEIPARKNELVSSIAGGKKQKKLRGRRVSLTFRKFTGRSLQIN